MPLITYVPKRFNDTADDMIETAVSICEEFARQNIQLTLRGLYYRIVARDLFPDDRKFSKNAAGKWVRDPNGTKNSDLNYKWLGDLMNDARLAGRVDWNHLQDVTRSLRDLAHWDSPSQIMDAVASQYRTDRWDIQGSRVEVWIEKDALLGVIQGVCNANDVPYFSCRGYTSQTAMWQAAQRLKRIEEHQDVIILHLGDHDPSGIDMTRDIRDRLNLFGAFPDVRRIALTMDQVEQYDPPPNPAKITDSRSGAYIDEYGDESWELDALDPAVMTALIQGEIDAERDPALWEEATANMDTDRFILGRVSARWQDVVTHIRALENGDSDDD